MLVPVMLGQNIPLSIVQRHLMERAIVADLMLVPFGWGQQHRPWFT